MTDVIRPGLVRGCDLDPKVLDQIRLHGVSSRALEVRGTISQVRVLLERVFEADTVTIMMTELVDTAQNAEEGNLEERSPIHFSIGGVEGQYDEVTGNVTITRSRVQVRSRITSAEPNHPVEIRSFTYAYSLPEEWFRDA